MCHLQGILAKLAFLAYKVTLGRDFVGKSCAADWGALVKPFLVNPTQSAAISYFYPVIT